MAIERSQASTESMARQGRRQTAPRRKAMPGRSVGRQPDDTGRSDRPLHDDWLWGIVEQTASQCGAQRVLVVVSSGTGTRQIAAAKLPSGEHADALLRAVTPWLDEALHTGRSRLRHGPSGAQRHAQRSCMVVPIVINAAVVGFLYADADGAHRRLDTHDLGRLEPLAAQAALALENARLFDETQRLLKETAQRNAELAVVNSIQQGIAGSLSFHAIVELVGEKLRELLHIDTIGIRWYDHATRTAHFLYEIEHGTRVTMAPVTASEARWKEVTADRSVIVRNTAAEVAAAGIAAGTDCSLSSLTVKIVTTERVVGVVVVESFEREYAFGSNEIRLLQTIVAEMGLALENARLFNETREALARQTASADILRVISQSPTDVQPVFDAIVQAAGAAVRGCGGRGESTARRSGGVARVRRRRRTCRGLATDLSVSPDPRLCPRRSAARWPHRRHCGCARRIIAACGRARAFLGSGFHAMTVVPMLHDRTAIGAIALVREQAGSLNAHQLELLQTFANQAVIAIENTRLFNETKQALERQTATAAILRVISQSPTDVQPVLDAVAERAALLCAATNATVYFLQGDELRSRATYAPHGQVWDVPSDIPVKRSLFNGRAVLDRRTLHVSDLAAVLDTEYPDARDNTLRLGMRTALAVPMIREGQAIGSIFAWRREVHPFADEEISLIQTFADQAVIAIENVRLFNETREALQRQTATAEVLRVISGSITDTQPVFDSIAERAARLTGAHYGMVFRFDGELIHVASTFGVSAQGVDAARAAFPMPPGDGSVTAMAVRDGRVAMAADVYALSDAAYLTKDVATSTGYRSVLSVPMVREGGVIGAISVMRPEEGRFAEHEVGLLQTFADQAVIAIENARLFNETQEALERQTATSEILKVIGRSAFELDPVFKTLIESGVKLCGGRADSSSVTTARCCVLPRATTSTPELRSYFDQIPFHAGPPQQRGTRCSSGEQYTTSTS